LSSGSLKEYMAARRRSGILPANQFEPQERLAAIKTSKLQNQLLLVAFLREAV
jgi:hypothetical protein